MRLALRRWRTTTLAQLKSFEAHRIQAVLAVPRRPATRNPEAGSPELHLAQTERLASVAAVQDRWRWQVLQRARRALLPRTWPIGASWRSLVLDRHARRVRQDRRLTIPSSGQTPEYRRLPLMSNVNQRVNAFTSTSCSNPAAVGAVSTSIPLLQRPARIARPFSFGLFEVRFQYC